MKCSFRRNCNAGSGIPSDEPPSLNEVQFPKELQPDWPSDRFFLPVPQ